MATFPTSSSCRPAGFWLVEVPAASTKPAPRSGLHPVLRARSRGAQLAHLCYMEVAHCERCRPSPILFKSGAAARLRAIQCPSTYEIALGRSPGAPLQSPTGRPSCERLRLQSTQAWCISPAPDVRALAAKAHQGWTRLPRRPRSHLPVTSLSSAARRHARARRRRASRAISTCPSLLRSMSRRKCCDTFGCRRYLRLRHPREIFGSSVFGGISVGILDITAGHVFRLSTRQRLRVQYVG